MRPHAHVGIGRGLETNPAGGVDAAGLRNGREENLFGLASAERIAWQVLELGEPVAWVVLGRCGSIKHRQHKASRCCRDRGQRRSTHTDEGWTG